MNDDRRSAREWYARSWREPRGARAVVAGLVAAVLLSGGLAVAAIPADDGTISACYGTDGRLWVVEEAATCRRGETRLTWNERGERGEPGVPGPAGEPGPQGPAGPAGPAGTGLESIEQLNGVPCRVGNPEEGITAVGYDASSRALDLSCTPSHLYDLTVTITGGGAGTVKSDPVGIDCPDTCSITRGNGDVVTLSAADSETSIFTGWGGACEGTGTCTVLLDRDQEVSANFVPSFRLTAEVRAEGVCARYDFYGDCAAWDTSRATGTLWVENVGSCDLPPNRPLEWPTRSSRQVCQWEVPQGTYIYSEAQGYPEVMTWARDCAAASNVCDLGPRTTNTYIEVRFNYA